MFPQDGEALELSAEKNADFFIQVLGGPPYFSQKYGPPMKRKRHLKFEITHKAREIWLNCFIEAFQTIKQEVSITKEEESSFLQFLENFSEWMVNTK